MKSNLIGRAAYSCLFIFGFLGVGAANAAAVTISAYGPDFLKLHFSVPVQPVHYNALCLAVGGSSPANPPFSAIASLYDGESLLNIKQVSWPSACYGADGSDYSGPSKIDFTSITDGSIDGIFTVRVTNGSYSFLSENFDVYTFDYGGNATLLRGTVLSIEVATVAPVVPVPPALYLFGSGLLGLLCLRTTAKR
ncbi:MAG: hypothetical protein HY941_08985 [Gammaproteobacteria bacterium]|nr:hypothetical protein [Gammaproteobacteria bacterium]